MPRFSFGYKLGEKNVIKGGYGVYYDTLNARDWTPNQDGFDVTMFEKGPELGGVWAASRTYPGLRANNPRETYAFSDFPYPETADDFPTAEQVRSYLNSYADHFGLRPLMRLSTEVVSVKYPAGTPGEAQPFEIVIRTTRNGGTTETHHFDFVAVCNGVFHEPNVPRLEGQEHFSGPILHSSRLVDPEVVVGKRIVVVGAGKSALASASTSCAYLRTRRTRWRSTRSH
jgi:cation diffusion facilitator CzcD-associated flavoprotein CzcO